MPYYQLSNKAKSDLRDIALYTQSQWGKEQRNHYIKALDNAFAGIAQYPLKGKDCGDIQTGYRKLPHASHVIFYTIDKTGAVFIVRILHKSVDIEFKF